ncbi:MAG: RdgB/HAM1 family non-canonical purine NTP pyrophosphatase [Candidatus Margulisiibacteriota bacterium]
MQIVLATSNKDKVREIGKILDIKGLKIASLSDFPKKIKVSENGRTFKENAVKKARAVEKELGLVSIADDSGLCVNALNKKPGVRSARFVAPPATPKRLCEKLLRVMKGFPEGKRTACFVCAVAIARPGKKIKTIEGKVKGSIICQLKGKRGFGYDPVFVPFGTHKTFAQISTAQKNRISHRGIAFRRTRKYLLSILEKK